MSLIRRVIEGFNAASVSYVVVGGIAVVMHGRVRITLDLDVIISLDSANIEKALKVIADEKLVPRLPVKPSDFADEAIRAHWVNDRNLKVLSFIDPKNAIGGVDLFATIPVDYQGLLANSVFGDIEGTPVRCCSLDDLIELKKIANRGIDREDIKELEIIRDAKKRKDR